MHACMAQADGGRLVMVSRVAVCVWAIIMGIIMSIAQVRARTHAPRHEQKPWPDPLCGPTTAGGQHQRELAHHHHR